MNIRINSVLLSLVLTAFVLSPLRAEPANPKADAVAYALLKTAHDARQVLPSGFGGFDSAISFYVGSQVHKGSLHFRTGGKSSLECRGISKDDKAWLEDQVFSMMGHRTGGDFAHGDGAYPISFGAAPDNDFGKLIELNDGMQSSYRVRGDKITEVTRMAGDTRFTVTVIETMPGDAGKNLPVHFMVAYRDAKTGALQGVEGYRDGYAKFGKAWLPVSRTVIAFGNETSPTVRSIRFNGIAIVK